VTLSTVHAIKGLEAEVVYLIGVNSSMYPCIAGDNLATSLNEYDKYGEELRLLYVAMTRAKKELIINYSSSLSPFITQNLKNTFSQVENGCIGPEQKLRNWRLEKSRTFDIKPYMVFPDRTLIQIVTEMPSSMDELLMIPGIGESKVMRYGKEILEILHGF